MTVETVDNIVDLKAYAIPTNADTVVYVEGYYNPGDGGGSMFWYDPNLNTIEDLGIHFRPNGREPGSKGMWVRQYDGYINAMFFGICKYPLSPAPPYNSGRIQNAIDYINRTMTSTAPPPDEPKLVHRGALTLFFPAGAYFIGETITLKNHIHMIGDNQTQFWVNTKLLNGKYMFVIEKGPISDIFMENFYLELGYKRDGESFNTGGFLIEAEVIDPDNPKSAGGLAGATFNNIKIMNTGLHGMWLKGGDGTVGPLLGRRCNQFIYCTDVLIERMTDKYNALRMTGLQCNVVFNYGGFGIPYHDLKEGDAPVMEHGTNVWIDSVYPGPSEDNAMIIFNNVGIGAGPGLIPRFGFVINHAENINMDNCWFENNAISVFVRNSKDVNILNSRFADANLGIYDEELGYMGDCIRVENSSVNVQNNFTTTSKLPYIRETNRVPLFIRGIGGEKGPENNTINALNNSFHDIILSNTYGIVQLTKIHDVPTYYFSPSTPATISGIETQGKKVLVVLKGDSDMTDIYRINSMINAGETLSILAGDANLTLWNWGSAGETSGHNINLGLASTASLPLLHGQTAHFIKADGVNNQERCAYTLLSIQ